MLLIQALMQVLVLCIFIFMSPLVRFTEPAMQAAMLARGHPMLVSFCMCGVEGLMGLLLLNIQILVPRLVLCVKVLVYILMCVPVMSKTDWSREQKADERDRQNSCLC